MSFTPLAQRNWKLPILRAVMFASYLIFTLSESFADPLSFTSGNSQVQIVEGNPRRITIHTVAPSQENIRILGHSQTDKECHQKAETDYDLIKPPLHGIVCFRDETFTIKNTENSRTPNCLGSSALGSVIYYRPNRAYLGTDAFQYAIVDEGHKPNTIADTAIIITAPLTRALEPRSEESSEGSSENRQIPGPMQRCPNPVM